MSIAISVSALLSVAGCGGSGGEKTGEQASKIMCEGGNSCSGHSECATSSSSCKGMNSCAGMGWVYADSDEECKMLQEANKPS